VGPDEGPRTARDGEPEGGSGDGPAAERATRDPTSVAPDAPQGTIGQHPVGTTPSAPDAATPADASSAPFYPPPMPAHRYPPPAPGGPPAVTPPNPGTANATGRRRSMVAVGVAVGVSALVLLAVVTAPVIVTVFGGAFVDAIYEVEAWAEANPARADRDPGTVPLLEHHDCPFADEPFGEDVRCATLVVPADRASDDGPTVDLAVAILPATGSVVAADPVLYLEGGPGGASVAWFDLWGDEGWPSDRDRDLILLDQRGTGYSSPSLGCGEVSEVLPSDAIDALGSCHDRVLADGADLAGISTPEHAADVEDLRLALGIDRWNLFGVSYGTRIALTVMDRYPDGVRSVVLDSVYPREVDVLEEQGQALVAAFEAMAEACTSDAACVRNHGDPRSVLRTAAAALHAEPLERDGQALDGDDLVDAVFYALYDQEYIEELPGILALAGTDPDAAFDRLEDPFDAGGFWSARRGGVPAFEDSEGTFHVVECREEILGRNHDAARSAAERLPAPFASAMVRQLERSIEACGIWAVEPAPLEESRPVVSDIPTLLLAGGLDPVTPQAWAERAAEGLAESQTVVLPSVGHAAIASGACPTRMIQGFLDDPGGPVERACAVLFDAPDFR
jgi:pimeloyl-ACP methyl ester carboxylesterase